MFYPQNVSKMNKCITFYENKAAVNGVQQKGGKQFYYLPIYCSTQQRIMKELRRKNNDLLYIIIS